MCLGHHILSCFQRVALHLETNCESSKNPPECMGNMVKVIRRVISSGLSHSSPTQEVAIGLTFIAMHFFYLFLNSISMESSSMESVFGFFLSIGFIHILVCSCSGFVGFAYCGVVSHCMNVAHCLTISTIDGHLDYFQMGMWVVMSKAAMTVLIYVFWWTEQFRYWYRLSCAPPQKFTC